MFPPARDHGPHRRPHHTRNVLHRLQVVDPADAKTPRSYLILQIAHVAVSGGLFGPLHLSHSLYSEYLHPRISASHRSGYGHGRLDSHFSRCHTLVLGEPCLARWQGFPRPTPRISIHRRITPSELRPLRGFRSCLFFPSPRGSDPDSSSPQERH